VGGQGFRIARFIISFSVAAMKAHKREAFPAWGEDTSEDFNQA